MNLSALYATFRAVRLGQDPDQPLVTRMPRHLNVIAQFDVVQVNDKRDTAVVLCQIENPHTPFVTWIRNHQDGSDNHGEYFKTLPEAHESFLKRAKARSHIEGPIHLN